MLKSITITLTALFFLSFSYSQSNRIYGSFESNAVYYQENEEESYENKLGSNNYLNINIFLTQIGMLKSKLNHICQNDYKVILIVSKIHIYQLLVLTILKIILK